MFCRVVIAVYAHLLFTDTFMVFRLVYPRHDEIIKELFGDGMPSAYELERNQSLLIHCADSSLIYPQAYTPNVIHIGPTHIEKPKPLSGVSAKQTMGEMYFNINLYVVFLT